MKEDDARKKLEGLGRECVREILRDGEDKAAVVVIGTVPRFGFPRGRMLGNDENGRPIRMYPATKMLAAVQQYMKRIAEAKP